MALQPFCLGASLAGAGGGGFLAALLRPAADRAAAVAAVQQLPGTQRVTFHQATVDTEGIQIVVGDTEVILQ